MKIIFFTAPRTKSAEDKKTQRPQRKNPSFCSAQDDVTLRVLNGVTLSGVEVLLI
jgi:hypothetical protein